MPVWAGVFPFLFFMGLLMVDHAWEEPDHNPRENIGGKGTKGHKG